MRYISDKEFKSQLRQIKNENTSRQRKQKLKNEKNKYKTKFKLPSTSKLMAAYLFIVLNAVLIYSMVAMWHFHDLTYLGALITDIAAQVLTYFIYSKKSTAENLATEGFVYEARMAKLNHADEVNEEEEE